MTVLSSNPDSQVYRNAGSSGSPSSHTAEDGVEVPIQRDWFEAQKPGVFDHLPMNERPFRVNQVTPRKLHVAHRDSPNPIYYFDRVRWVQEAGAKGEKRYLTRTHFTSVRVDLSKVRAAHFFFKPFEPKWLAGHAAIHLEMEPGGFTSLDGEDGNGFVLSYEAHIRAGQTYSALRGQFGAYPSIHVVGNYPDFVFRSVVLDHPLILRRWTLTLSRDELVALGLAVGRTVVLNSPEVTDEDIDRISQASGRTYRREDLARPYNSFLRSCVHAVIHVLNDALPRERRVPLRWLGGLIPNPRLMIPSLTQRALRSAGLIGDQVLEVHTMEEGLGLARSR